MTLLQATSIAYSNVPRPRSDARHCFTCPLEENKKHLIIRSITLDDTTLHLCIKCANLAAARVLFDTAKAERPTDFSR